MASFCELPDDVLWHLVVHHINYPDQFVAFSRVCRKTARVTRRLQEWAKNRFSMQIVMEMDGPKVRVTHLLPSRLPHGCTYCWDGKDDPDMYVLRSFDTFNMGILHGFTFYRSKREGTTTAGQYNRGVRSGLWITNDLWDNHQRIVYEQGAIVYQATQCPSDNKIRTWTYARPGCKKKWSVMREFSRISGVARLVTKAVRRDNAISSWHRTADGRMERNFVCQIKRKC